MGEIIVALNTNNRDEAIHWVKTLKEHARIFKIGLPLFTMYGPAIVGEIRDLGVEIFLDMKLHDIPSVIGKTIESLRNLEVKFVTIHLSGGKEMAGAALDAAEGRIEIIGVTVLTSIGKEEFQRLYSSDLEETVKRMVEAFVEIGGKNIVLSGQEAPLIKKLFDVRVFVPGIRPKVEGKEDQSRVVTPSFARQNKFDYIVVGRPITHSDDPVKSYLEIKREFNGT